MNDGPLKLPASLPDLDGLDLESPLSDCRGEDALSIRDAFLRARTISERIGNEAGARVYESLGTVCSSMANFDFPAEPYRPLWSKGNRRSFIPDDLTDSDIALLEAMLTSITIPWLRARIIDCFFLKKARRDLWPEGVTAYLQAAHECYPKTPREARNCFARALYLGKILGMENQPRREAVDATIAFVLGNAATLDPRMAVAFLRLIQKSRIGDATDFSVLSESLARTYTNQQKFAAARDAWLVSGTWLRQLGEQERSAAARLSAARLFETEGDSHLSITPPRYWPAIDCFLRGVQELQQAIAPPDDVNRVKQKLRDCQRSSQMEAREAVWKEAPIVFDPINAELNSMAESARGHVANQPWPLALLRLACGDKVAEPSKTREQTLKFAEMAPITALMMKDYPGEVGRVAYRQGRLLLASGEKAEQALREAMFEHARQFEWDVRASAFIEPARQQIWEEHQPTVNDLAGFVADNPIIPQDHSFAILRGLHAGISGDWLVSGHLLAVKFEPILRHLLERREIDSAYIESDLTQPNRLLGSLLDLVQKHSVLPDGYIFEIRGMLNEKTGYDFRNRIAHGFATDNECFASSAAINLWWLLLNICANAGALLCHA